MEAKETTATNLDLHYSKPPIDSAHRIGHSELTSKVVKFKLLNIKHNVSSDSQE